MLRVGTRLIATTVACAFLSSSLSFASPDLPVARDVDTTATCPAANVCPRQGPDEKVKQLPDKLPASTKVYFPGSPEFEEATTRWSVLEEPHVNAVVVPGREGDVAKTVTVANELGLPFLAYDGVHGSITTLGKMDSGIAISMDQLSSVEISKDGKTAKIGGGTMSKTVTDKLWAAGKQTVTGTCECVSYMGPALGGGHGWLQGHHGLIADQWVSMNIVLADGSAKTVDAKSDLWWALDGAGHNFGIVTSVTTKIFDIEHKDWAVETITFSGDKVEDVYKAANEHLTMDGKQPVDVINWSYWLNNPDADPNNPVIIFYILQEGVTSVDPKYTKPFHDIGPLSAVPESGIYTDLAAWTGVAVTAPPCAKGNGFAHPRFPIYLEKYNPASQKKAYELFASQANANTPFNTSIFMFEGYSMQGVKAVEAKSTAFAFREDNLLNAPLISYSPVSDETLVKNAEDLGNQLRQILLDGSGRNELHAYVNYAYGNETPKQWYGSEAWRQDRLKNLKSKYDPDGRFSFYGPIPLK